MKKTLRQIVSFYYEGFKAMTVGRTLWAIIIFKLFLIFFVLKLFFFPDFLKKKFDNNVQRGNYVIEQLIKR
ncbi:MAG: DUF4492 domain-containing protein [Bacteroidota bacterium]|nr:DUF4492 domain-containing protein [Bacteroidota bacterium]MDP4225792.1 DUF4492 domain-containing protein [Bacteroidota bacterium]